jgi:sialate O-acetylesterase
LFDQDREEQTKSIPRNLTLQKGRFPGFIIFGPQRNFMRILSAWLFLFLVFQQKTFPQLRLPSILSSGMVLQQNDSARIWGWGYTGQNITVTASWDSKPLTTTVSNLGTWQVILKTPSAGGPFTLDIRSPGKEITLQNVLVGEVWLCSGQSNMEYSYQSGARFIKEEFPNCQNDQIRFYQVPRASSEYPQDDIRSEWASCDSNSLKPFSAVGYFFGKILQHDLKVPIGLINASWGGTPAEAWTPAETIFQDDTLKSSAATLKEVPWGPVRPGYLYNGMIAPNIRFTLAGVIWYQGEANTGNYSTYSRLLTRMIQSWRRKWNREFPFYFVQIAPYQYEVENSGALLQEQQAQVMSLPRTGMVVTTDLIDSVTNIHPSDKRFVGSRLAGWALAESYHRNTGPYKSPSFRELVAQKSRLLLHFNDAPNGLISKGSSLTGFYISGESESWLPAEGKIEKDGIEIWNKDLKNPVYARYGFGNTIIGNVFSPEGLPLCPFRTDSFPASTNPIKN